MQTYEAIVTRRSTRKFKEEAVERKKLEKVVEAGRFAPSGTNSRKNHFLVLEDKKKVDELAVLVEKIFAQKELNENTSVNILNSIKRAKKGGYVYSYGAPILIIVANEKGRGNNIADCAAAIENMMLEANELDLGSCWVNQLRWLKEPELIAYLQKLGMRENERVYGAVVLGYPDTPDGKPDRRKVERTGNEVTWIH